VRKRRQQVRFVRETLAANRALANRHNHRVIVSLSTVPDRINNLSPTKQTRPPDEIVLAIQELEERPYVVPEYLLRLPLLRILHCAKELRTSDEIYPGGSGGTGGRKSKQSDHGGG
jgi:hypothetical protein